MHSVPSPSFHVIDFGGNAAWLMPSGALFFPELSALCVADLHLAKGSYFAQFGSLLPPYDSKTTLIQLAQDIASTTPKALISLGDSFHDKDAVTRLEPENMAMLHQLAHQVERWWWVTGNHDEALPSQQANSLPGIWQESLILGGITFQHEANPHFTGLEISGHYHPKTTVTLAGHTLSRPCFVQCGGRLILPSYGTYTGGLSLKSPAFSPLLTEGYRAYMLHNGNVFAV